MLQNFPSVLKLFTRIDHLIMLAFIEHFPTPEGYIAQAKALVPLVRQFVLTVKQLEKQVVAVFKTHPEAAWWKSLPGGRGSLTPARMLAWIGDERTCFPTAEALQAIAGATR